MLAFLKLEKAAINVHEDVETALLENAETSNAETRQIILYLTALKEQQKTNTSLDDIVFVVDCPICLSVLQFQSHIFRT